MHPDQANESELSITRGQHSRNARNADYKAMLNARIAVRRTVEYVHASEQERERLLRAAMAEASARRYLTPWPSTLLPYIELYT